MSCYSSEGRLFPPRVGAFSEEHVRFRGFKKLLADAHADGVPSKVGIVRSDNGASSLMANLEKCVNSPT